MELSEMNRDERLETRDILDHRPGKLHCKKCGSLLKLIKEEDASYYDEADGHKVVVTYHFYRCPNKRWWWFFDEHEKFNDSPMRGYYF